MYSTQVVHPLEEVYAKRIWGEILEIGVIHILSEVGGSFREDEGCRTGLRLCRRCALMTAAGIWLPPAVVQLPKVEVVYYQRSESCNEGNVDKVPGAGSCVKTLQEMHYGGGLWRRRLDMAAARGCAIVTAPHIKQSTPAYGPTQYTSDRLSSSSSPLRLTAKKTTGNSNVSTTTLQQYILQFPSSDGAANTTKKWVQLPSAPPPPPYIAC